MIIHKNKVLLILLFLQFAFLANAQYQTTPNKKGKGYFTNPIFGEDYPDPSILRDRNGLVKFKNFKFTPN